MEFDEALIGAVFALAGERGWPDASIPEAARRRNLPLAKARERFPNRAAVLLKLGRLADQGALAETPKEGTVRDRLFYLIMQRLDLLQAHRAGILGLMRALPTEPGTAALLGCATKRSMRWLLEAAGVSSRGLRGEIRTNGLLAVWLWALRAWQGDETADLSQTMKAVDSALQRAERLGGWLGGAQVPSPAAREEVSGTEIPQGEPPEPESPPPPAPGPETPPTSLPPEPLA